LDGGRNARTGTDKQGSGTTNELRTLLGARKLTGELYFPLAPRLLLATWKERKGGDVVIAEFCYRLIIGIR